MLEIREAALSIGAWSERTDHPDASGRPDRPPNDLGRHDVTACLRLQLSSASSVELDQSLVPIGASRREPHPSTIIQLQRQRIVSHARHPNYRQHVWIRE